MILMKKTNYNKETFITTLKATYAAKFIAFNNFYMSVCIAYPILSINTKAIIVNNQMFYQQNKLNK